MRLVILSCALLGIAAAQDIVREVRIVGKAA